MDRKNIPMIIKETRIARGLTQKKLGELCGYEGHSAQATVQKWEYGQNPVPLDRLRSLALALGLTLDQLIP